MMKRYQLGIYEKAMPNFLSWKEKLDITKEAGFDFLEMSIDETDEKLRRLDYSKEERKEIADAMQSIGIPIRTMCLSGHRKYPLGSNDPTVRARSLEIMEKAIILAWDLGIRIIQIAGYDVYYEQSTDITKEYFFENLIKSVEMAAAYGVILAFETMETEFINTVSKAMQFVRKVNSPYLGIYPDSGNITNAAKTYGADVFEDIATGEGHVFAFHLKETVPGKFREIPFGTGHVDFPAIVKAAFSQSVHMFTAEFWCTDDNWKETIFDTRHFFTEIFGNL